MGIRVHPMTCKIGRLSVIGVFVVVPLAAACGGGDDTAGPVSGIAVGDIQHDQYLYQGKYLGRTVTVSGPVSDVRGSSSFELAGGGYGKDTMLVMTGQPVAVVRGQLVRVTGTVGQYHHSAPSERVPYIQRDLYTRHETEAYLYDATVEPS